MKRILTITAIAFSVMLVASFKNTLSAQPRVDAQISYQTFYDELDPYGRWVDYPEYGYVWIPDCGPEFRPYSTNGHWVWSDDYDWIWVSDYDWGWAPFHYGRWLEDSYYGWIWVPGYEWSPAWVAWRDGGDYYGWAPLRPGINISIGFSLGGYDPPVDYWCFAPRRYITSPRIYDYCEPRRNNITIINNTTIINNYNYNRNVFRTGPGRREAERYTGRIQSARFRDSGRPGRDGFRNNEVSIYRPRVGRDNNRSFAPRKFEHFDGNRGGNRDVGGRNGNNLPQSGNRGNNQPGRRFDNSNNDGSGRERSRPFERREIQQPANPGNNQPGRRFDNSNNDGGVRERSRPFERREIQQPSNPGNTQPGRRFDNSNNDGGARERSRPFERREMQQQPQRQQQPQPQPQPRQEQPRQSERRNDNSGGNRGGGDNGSGSHGFGRRGR